MKLPKIRYPKISEEKILEEKKNIPSIKKFLLPSLKPIALEYLYEDKFEIIKKIEKPFYFFDKEEPIHFNKINMEYQINKKEIQKPNKEYENYKKKNFIQKFNGNMLNDNLNGILRENIKHLEKIKLKNMKKNKLQKELIKNNLFKTNFKKF